MSNANYETVETVYEVPGDIWIPGEAGSKNNEKEAPSEGDAREGEQDGLARPITGHAVAYAAIGFCVVAAVAVVLFLVGSTTSASTETKTNSLSTEEPRPIEAPEASETSFEKTVLTTPTKQDESESSEGVVAALCEHEYKAAYEKVHYEAKPLEHEPEYRVETTYHTVCNICKESIDGRTDEHEQETGHAAFTVGVPIESEVLVSQDEAAEEPEHDEFVFVGEFCAKCGDFRMTEETGLGNE